MSSGANSLSSQGHDSLSVYDWTFDEHKAFEVALASNLDKEDRWERTAACVNNKSPHDVHSYFLQLEDDLRRIEEGLVPVPEYEDSMLLDLSEPLHCLGQPAHELQASVLIPQPAPHKPPKSQPSPKKAKTEGKAAGSPVNHGAGDKRKGVPWTEEEHRLFLLGLAKFGKGDWRSIARNFVVSRTPTQVASHAQKYFIRLNSASGKKEKRRSSIHDITSATIAGLDNTMCQA